jgi:hypothetical protein
MKHIYIIILTFILPAIASAQDSNNVHYYTSAPLGAVRIIFGVGGIYGWHYGGSVFIMEKWSIELAQGKNASINLGGGNYSMVLTGGAINRYLPIKAPFGLVFSVLYSYANVTETTYEYPGDFTIVSPMIGIDFSKGSGLASYIRIGLLFKSGNIRNDSKPFVIDGGICWQFNLFGAP